MWLWRHKGGVEGGGGEGWYMETDRTNDVSVCVRVWCLQGQTEQNTFFNGGGGQNVQQLQQL